MVSPHHSTPALQGHPLSAGSCTGAQDGSTASSTNNLVDGHSSHDKHGSAEMWHPTPSLTDFVDAVQSAHERLADRSTSGKQARMEGKSAAASALSAIPGLNSLLQPLKPSEGTKSHQFTGGHKGDFAKGGR
ncbi:hypothetical protein CABS03_13205 [Colletotrichum abscissum]|uniref:Uncharacterized protein n=3 Tax=Colletotrichum acutatum species complex TaxID=2707335 RepID=A0A9Q0AZI3_9PEZI|nr:uncharacterized protein CTAM01_05101 [Colletotrichum tamarilloi]KAI3548906.1 hypothetical protein CABS02_08109 [Colletotrichum abscissum]KAK1502288.1 hypothetical protein CTAM01_05101 [Colletotrichum tamarilloi]